MTYAVGYLYKTVASRGVVISRRRHILVVEHSREGIDYHRGTTLCGKAGAVRTGWVVSTRAIALSRLMERTDMCLSCKRAAGSDER